MAKTTLRITFELDVDTNNELLLEAMQRIADSVERKDIETDIRWRDDGSRRLSGSITVKGV